MRILLAVLAIGAVQAGIQDSPEMLIRLALERNSRDKVISQTLVCDKDEAIEELDGNGKPKGQIKDEDSEDKNHLSMNLAKLFKEGRYTYWTEGLTMLNDRIAIKIQFVPGPEEKQPGPEERPNEGMRTQEVEKGLNKVLNRLHGTMYLDQETLGIVRLEAHLPEEVFHKMVWVSKTDITYEQTYVFGIWVPKRSVTDTRIA